MFPCKIILIPYKIKERLAIEAPSDSRKRSIESSNLLHIIGIEKYLEFALGLLVLEKHA